jgi:hypothetical protein
MKKTMLLSILMASAIAGGIANAKPVVTTDTCVGSITREGSIKIIVCGSPDLMKQKLLEKYNYYANKVISYAVMKITYEYDDGK